jgi:hypothetical protein
MEPIHYVLLAILVFFLILIITQKANAFFLTHGYDGYSQEEEETVMREQPLYQEHSSHPPIHESTHRPSHESTHHPSHESTHRPSHESTHHPSHESTHPPIHESTHPPTQAPSHESTQEKHNQIYSTEPEGVGSSSLLHDISTFYKDLKDDIYTFFYPHDEQDSFQEEE